jgi:hypothetical protein
VIESKHGVPMWYLARNGEKYGPYSVAQLRQLAASGQVVPNDMLLQEGTQYWVEAMSIPEVFFPASPPPPLARKATPLPGEVPLIRAPKAPPDSAPARVASAPPPAKESAGPGESTALRCPKCGSENVQSLKVIYEMGTSTVQTTSSGTITGVGVALGTGGAGFGVTSQATQGVHQSTAAKAAAPPTKKEYVAPGCALLLGIGAGIAAVVWSSSLPALLCAGLVCMGFLAAGVIGSVVITKWNEQEWPRLYVTWLKSFRCLRCGEVFRHSMDGR